MQNKTIKFNKQFLKELWQILAPYWSSEEKWFALALLLINIGCLIGMVRANVGLNHFINDFTNSLQNFNKPGIYTAVKHFLVIIIAGLVFAAGISYFGNILTLRWKRWLTKHYINKWLFQRTFYHLQNQNINKVDNPDQRIAEDIDQFTSSTLSTFIILLQAALTFFSFNYILWNLSSTFSFSLGSMHVKIPGYLCWSALLYAVIGTWLTAWLGKKLGMLDYQQQHFNADFRFGLMRCRESGEQIASLGGEAAEENKFRALFNRIFSNEKSIIWLTTKLESFSFAYKTISILFGYIIALPLYFAKKIQIGNVLQISGAISNVISSLSIILSAYPKLVAWRVVIHRLAEFDNSMLKIHKKEASLIDITEHEHQDIIIDKLNLSLPDGTSLITNVDFNFSTGKSTLINAPSGHGKTTLLRALAGLWTHGEGSIRIPKNKRILFLPQKPYLPLGSFKEILSYPHHEEITDMKIQEILKLCGLDRFKDKLNEVKNWAQELSLGEQQLVSLFRVFITNPDIIFLDEATSALDEAAERRVYENLRTYLPDSIIVSTGHRRSLHELHDTVIGFSRA